MNHSAYLANVKQTNGCRVWDNPLTNVKYNAPANPVEIFIKNLPKDMFEDDILPSFERFGPIFQFRLLIDYDNQNRGFGYLIYYWDYSAFQCLDLMRYFLIKPGVMMDVEISLERSHLKALNIPTSLTDEEIEQGIRSIYNQVSRLVIKRNTNQNSSTCKAILEFPDHQSALAAKRWSGVGTVNLWNQNIKILWALKEETKDLIDCDEEAKHILAHNVPEDTDPEDFALMMRKLISPEAIISIRPMKTDWLIEFASTQAAYTIFQHFDGLQIENNVMKTEWVDNKRFALIDSYADFDWELRCLCLANYWDPPIFIYGRIISFTKTQLCAVIIKNNRKNLFTTFYIEVCFEDLVEIHARVCEVLVLYLMEMKDLPRKDLVFQCTKEFVFLAGFINNLMVPTITPSSLVLTKPLCLYLDDIYALSKMCYQLIASEMLDDLYDEYKIILKEKNIFHQFLCSITSDGNILGCIDPIYRRGKPLKYQLDTRHMILVLCDSETLSNIGMLQLPTRYDLRRIIETPKHFKIDKIELIPLKIVQRKEVHFTARPYVEFNQVDTFSDLKYFQQALALGTAFNHHGNINKGPLVPIGTDAQVHAHGVHCWSDILNALPI